MKTKILIVEDNPQMQELLSEFVSSQEEYELVGVVADGIKAISFIESKQPDIAILDIVMPELDGFGVLEQIHTMPVKVNTKFLVLSALSQETFIAKALRLGADYYMIKPFDFYTLKNRLKDLSQKTRSIYGLYESDVRQDIRPGKNKALEEKITNIFITVGIPAHIKGYQFLREAIKLAIINPEIINSITKGLYPAIADKFETSSSKVERAIRHAIEVAWNRGKIENINTLFGVRVYSSNDKPTNGEFIALVADKMLIEGA